MEENVRSFAKYSRHEHEVLTDLLGKTLLNENINGILVHRVPPTRRLEFSRIYKALNALLGIIREINRIKYFRELDYDILHLRAPYLGPDLFYYLDHHLGWTFFKKVSAWRLSNKPILVTFHALPSFVLTDQGFGDYHLPMTECLSWGGLIRLLCEKATAIVCVDRYMQRALGMLYPEKEVLFIPSGVDSSVYKPMNKEVALHSLPASIQKILEKDKFYVLYLGRLTDSRGAHLIAPLASTLPRNSKLVVVGDGPVSPKKTDNIIRISQVPNTLVPYLINVCDAVFNPVLVPGVSRITLEAMACGKVTIMLGRKTDRFPAVDGYNCLVADDLIDARKLIIDQQKSDSSSLRIRDNAIATAEVYSVQRLAAKLDEVYDRIGTSLNR